MTEESLSTQYSMPARFLSWFWLFPFLYYFYMVFRYSINLPGGEEVEIFVNDVLLFLEQNGSLEKLNLIFLQHAEHRPATIKIFSLLSYGIFDEVNFDFLNVIGNTFLFIPMMLVAATLSRNVQDFLLYLLPAITLLASPVHHSCILWTSCSVSQYGSLFWGGLALFFACRAGLLSFMAFEFCAFWGYVTLGNGLIIIPLGFVCLFVAQPLFWRYKLLVAHLLLSLLFVFLYFHDFQTYGIYETSFRDATASLTGFIGNIFLWQVSWIGSWATFHDSRVIALSVGSLEIIAMLFLLARYRLALFEKYRFLMFFILYLLLSIAIASFQRSWLLPYEMVFQPRYKMYSLFLAGLLLMLSLSLLKEALSDSGRPAWAQCVIVVSLPIAVFWVSSTLRFESKLEEKSERDMACIEAWHRNRDISHCGWTLKHKIMVSKAEKAGLINMRN